MYYFKTIEELKKAVYVKADEFHSSYIANIQGQFPIKNIGLQYIRFGAKEKHLFRFLFQSNGFSGKSISDLTSAKEAEPVYVAIAKSRNITLAQARVIFKSLFLSAHGYASMFANNDLEYDEETILSEQYGLCSFKGSLKNYLYFIPLGLITSVNLWNGVTINISAFEIVLFIISMLCVGFIEEIIFRGFLFKAMCKDNIKSSVFVSSIGMGHIVNLLNGSALIPTLLQICYATAIGFLFTIIFYKGKSLLPCIITHGITNSLAIFAVQRTQMISSITSIVLCIISLLYALILYIFIFSF